MPLLELLRGRAKTGEKFRLEESAVKRIAHVVKLAATPVQPYAWNDSRYWLDDAAGVDAISQFFTLGNSINFKYWTLKRPGEIGYTEGYKGGVFARGAQYMWRCLRVCLDNGTFPILDADRLQEIRLQDVRRIFESDTQQDIVPNLDERLTNWRDLGAKLAQSWKGQFLNVVKGSRSSLERFAQLSSSFRAFDDPLCKMTMVNAIMHEGRGLVRFIESPLPAIDYQLVKQLLRQGVIIPDVTVADSLASYDLLSHREADELRGTALLAFARIIELTSVRGDVIDNMWWMNGKKCTDDSPVCQQPGREKECPFLDACEKKVTFRIPLEETRYY